MDQLTPKQKIAAARIVVQKKAPYFARALRSLIPYEAPGLGTFAVTEKGVLMYYPAKAAEWEIDELAAVLIHELSHVIRSHAARAERMQVGPNQRLLWNIAADAEINDDLVDHGWNLPSDPVTPRKLEMRDGLTAEEYFRKLLKEAEADDKMYQHGQSGSETDEEMSSPGGGGQSPEQDDEQTDDAGGGGGGESDDESKADHSEGGSDDKSPMDQQIQPSNNRSGHKKPCSRCGSGAGYEAPAEPDIAGKSEAEMERMRNIVAQGIREAASRSRGSVPGNWARWAEERLKPPEVPWQQKLGVLARRAVTYKAGVVDYKYDRPARRQSAFGFGAGKIILPRMRAPVPQVTIAIDTSGSMGTAELTAALREAKGILNATGASVEILAADTRVTDCKKIHRVEEARKMLKGGGGTDFRPVFRMLEKRTTGKPDIVVYMTDGYGPAPHRAPKGMHVIWLLMGSYGFKKPCNWGTAIEVKNA